MPLVNLDVGGFGYEQLVVTYIPFPEEFLGKHLLIKNVIVHTTGLRSKKRRYYPFKVNLFPVNGKQSYPNIADSLITSITTARKKGDSDIVSVDVKDYNLTMPEEGVFVGFETLSKKEHPNDRHYITGKFIFLNDTKGHNDYGAAVKKLKLKKGLKSLFLFSENSKV